MKSKFVALLLPFALAGCAQQPPGNDPALSEPGVVPAEDQQERDWAEIERLENEAKALARATGCTSSEGCRTAPVGNRACGGPRYYLVYCAATTDSTALFARLREVVDAENEYNEEYEIASTCEFRMPPEIAFSGGECRPATEQRSTP
ncbi:MAG TPA: hypothetical protein VFZ56_02710 [Gemmatimonadaceae bacterium]